MQTSATFRPGAAAATVLFAAMLAYGQAPGKAEDRTLKVDVDLVLVNATVTDSENRYVPDLDGQHFRIWEDKVEQKVQYFSAEDSPASLGIVLDVSGSMKDTISAARTAASTFLKMGNPADDYFLVEFSDRPKIIEDFTTDVGRLQERLVFNEAKGRTSLYDAIYLALEKVKHGSNAKKAILVITDGEDNHSHYTFTNIKEIVKESDVQIYAIGLVGNQLSELAEGRRGRWLIEQLTEAGGGRAFFPDSVDELETIAIRIAVELKNQYVLGYMSTNGNKDQHWRNVQVKVAPQTGLPHLNVRAKRGYFAASK